MSIKLNYVDDHVVNPVFLIEDAFNVLEEYDLTRRDLLNLCGGIPTDDIEHVEVQVYSSYKSALHIRVVSELYELTRSIDFDTKHIDNHFMLVYKRGNFIGTSLFLNQVRAARLRKFRDLNVVALAPGASGQTGWIGYYCWGRLGYKMIQSDQEDFEQWARQRNRKESTLNELLLSEEGCKLWKAQGFGWIGKFCLDDLSGSIKYLKDYLERKQIKIEL